jgi:hypothetical protein
MPLINTLNQLKKTLPRYAFELPRLRQRNAVLAKYESTDAILAALDSASGLGDAERGRIVAALAHDHQTHGGQLAQHVLAVAFEKTLLGIRTRLRQSKNEDLDQRVLLAFFEVLKRPAIVKAGDFAPVAIAKETKKAIFGRVRSEKKNEIPMRSFDDEKYVAGDIIERTNESREANLERIHQFLESAADELRDVVMQTVAENESLKDYVDRALPGADEKQRKLAYERLRSERYAAMERLRTPEEP